MHILRHACTYSGELFDQWDLNGDGHISTHEQRLVVELSELYDADTEGDSLIAFLTLTG